MHRNQFLIKRFLIPQSKQLFIGSHYSASWKKRRRLIEKAVKINDEARGT